jgi:trimethylamine--corrinoid protein Co-methyltransferase
MDNPVVTPRLRLLEREHIEHIHQSALAVLANPGVRVDSPHTRRLFATRLGRAAVQDDRVCIPADAVEWALKSAPPVIDIFQRTGQPAFQLGADRARFGIGVTTLFYQDPLTDQLTPFTRSHMEQMVRLGDSLPNFDVISTVGIVQDVPPHLSDLYATLDMTANTTKPLVVLVSDENRFPAVLDLLEHLHGDLSQRPSIIPYFNPVTPLVLNAGTTEKMSEAIQRGLPLIFSNYSMAGASTPITPAGTMVVLLAELLAGLVLSQLVREGASVILGMLPAFFDMKTLVNFYDPQSMLVNLACAEIMEYYHLPHCGTSGSGTGWGPDLLASDTYWMNHLTACLTKGGLAPFVGDTLTSKAFSPVNMVYVHEVIEQALRYSRGLRLDEQAVNLPEIQRIGPGGNFLTSKFTRQLYPTAYYNSPIFPRYSLEKWESASRPSADNTLRQHTQRLLAQLSAPAFYQDLLARGESFIQCLPSPA